MTATIDVSELLLDPDFVSPVTLIHRTASVDTHGKLLLSESSQDTIGSVQPASSKELLRVPESLRMSDWRAFYIKAEILSDGASQYPDLISFNGKRYEIKSTEPWINWGAGWNKGLCVAQGTSL